MSVRSAVVVGWLLLLAGCGGGDGSGAPIAVVPGGGAPGPAPTPAPTPTPSPPPAPSYETIDLDRALLLTGDGIEVSFRGFDTPTDVVISEPRLPDRASLQITPATQSATVRYDEESTSFAAADIQSANSGRRIWSRLTPDGGFNQLFVQRPTDFNWVVQARQAMAEISPAGSIGSAGRIDRTRLFLLGQRTLLSDFPRSGRFGYGGEVIAAAAAQRGDLVGGVTASVDWRAGTLGAAMSVAPQFGSSNYLSFAMIVDARIDPTTKLVSGTISSPDNRTSGTVSGRAFGPQAAEIGLLLRFTRRDGANGVALVVVRKFEPF
jgi:hypothetical protein